MQFVEFLSQVTDFNKYVFLGIGNRDTKVYNIKNITESFDLYGSIGSTIVVIETSAYGKKKRIIADGQHRVKVAKETGEALDMKVIKFTPEFDTPENVTKYIAALNNVQVKWSTNDYMDNYSANGIHEYKVFIEMKNRYKLTITDLLHIFLGCGSNKDYKSGGMVFENEDDSREMARQISRIMPHIPKKVMVRRNLPSVMRGYDYKMFADAVIKASKLMKLGGSIGFPEDKDEFREHMIRIRKMTFKKEVA